MAASLPPSRGNRTDPDPLDTLGALVLKQGVALGGLTHPERLLALRVLAEALPTGTEATEAQVNAALKQRLAAEGRFLDADHVELRRWLIDTGWWRRDGFGRSYARVPPQELADDLRAIEAALAPLALGDWIAARREADRARRDARRSAWQAGRTDGRTAPTPGP